MVLFIADECIAGRIVKGLRGRGFDIVDAKEVCKGDNDERALALAAASGRVLITEDWGFGELAVRHGDLPRASLFLEFIRFPQESVKSMRSKKLRS